MNTRSRVLLATLAASIFSAIWVARNDDVGSGVVGVASRGHERAATPRPSRVPAKSSDVQPTVAADWRDTARPIDNAFRIVSFVPPPPPPPPPRPIEVAKPTAPTFPFRFFGRVDTGDGDALYLARDDRLIAIAPKQVVDENYRIDSINANEVRITYLPLNEQTVLTLPAGR